MEWGDRVGTAGYSIVYRQSQRLFSYSVHMCVIECVPNVLLACFLAALEDAIEALSSGAAIELPLIQPLLTLMQDYNQPLERYDDYEDDDGELRAESNLAEKFGESPPPPSKPLAPRYH